MAGVGGRLFARIRPRWTAAEGISFRSESCTERRSCLAFSTEARKADPRLVPPQYLEKDGVPRKKHKTPRKKASSMLAILKQEALQKSKSSIKIPRFETGDAIECDVLPHITSPVTEPVRGIVIGRFNRGIASSFIIRDVLYDEPIERRIPIYSPLLKAVRIIKKRAIYSGKKEGKRVRRSKIYYIREKHEDICRVTGVLTGRGAKVYDIPSDSDSEEEEGDSEK